MLTVETRHAIDPAAARGFDTDALRRHFHLGDLFRSGEIRLVYNHYDRIIVGGAVPAGGPLTLDEVRETDTPLILDRRELVVVNVGGPGAVTAGERFDMERGDMLYLGQGSDPITCEGEGRFYLLSAPAHTRCASSASARRRPCRWARATPPMRASSTSSSTPT